MMEGFRRPHLPAGECRGVGTFVKFHWKPKLGTYSLVWDEAQKIAARTRTSIVGTWKPSNPAATRVGTRGTADPGSDRFSFDFDLLDATKLIPEGTDSGSPGRPDGPEPEPGQLLRRNGTGSLSHRQPGPRNRFTNDPLQFPQLLLSRHPADRLGTQTAQIGRPATRRCSKQSTRRVPDGQHRIPVGRSASPEHPRRWMPSARWRTCSATTPEAVDGETAPAPCGSFKITTYEGAHVLAQHVAHRSRTHRGGVRLRDSARSKFTRSRAAVVDPAQPVDNGLARPGCEAKLGLPQPPEVTVDRAPSPALSLIKPNDTIATRRSQSLAADGVDVEGTQKLINAFAGYRRSGCSPLWVAPRPNRRQRWRAGRRSRAGDDGIRPLRRRGGATADGRDNHAVRGRPGRAFSSPGVPSTTRRWRHFGADLDLLRKAEFRTEWRRTPDVLNDRGVL